MVNTIPYNVVAFGAVATTAADQSVIPVYVHDPLAEAAGEGFCEDWRSEPPLNHGFEKRWLDLGV